MKLVINLHLEWNLAMYDVTSSLSHISPYLLCNLVPDCRIWDNSVGMETHYGLDGPGIESR